jgi:hypothetical protein
MAWISGFIEACNSWIINIGRGEKSYVHVLHMAKIRVHLLGVRWSIESWQSSPAAKECGAIFLDFSWTLRSELNRKQSPASWTFQDRFQTHSGAHSFIMRNTRMLSQVTSKYHCQYSVSCRACRRANQSHHHNNFNTPSSRSEKEEATVGFFVSKARATVTWPARARGF